MTSTADRLAQARADAAGIDNVAARETEAKLARRRAAENQHNAEFHGGGACDLSCEDQ